MRAGVGQRGSGGEPDAAAAAGHQRAPPVEAEGGSRICVRSIIARWAHNYSAGPANSNRFPSGSLTMKVLAPHGSFLSVWKKVTPLA